LDNGAARALVGEGDQPLDRRRLALESRLDRAVPVVAHPAAHAVLLGQAANRVAEEHPLYLTVDDDPLSHGRYYCQNSMSFGFVERVAAARIGATFNFYRDGPGAECRRERLAGYLEARAGAPFILVGEAPGYRGARVSGIPFTSERLVSGGAPGEATATIVHCVLAELGVLEHVLLWNLVPTHPHLPGRPLTNRTPTRSEVRAGRPFLDELAPGRRVIPVGRLAQAVLGGPYVRHPSHGGAAVFRTSLREALQIVPQTS
jgi:hypothetical protein